MPPSLRTPTSAAPLKLRYEQPSSVNHSTLRTPTSAAPLKQKRVGVSAEEGGFSPHSNECGSVEAWRVLRCTHVVARALRTPTSAAPLKPAVGPGAEDLVRALRTPTSAAPLKRHARPTSTRAAGALRTPTSAAPLKLTNGETRACERGGSPHSNECGSVEASFSPRHDGQEVGLSALQRVRLR